MPEIFNRLAPALFFGLLSVSAPTRALDGLIEIKSSMSVKNLMSKLEDTAKKQGHTIYARVDHTAGASSVGRRLRPTELLIFGSPQGGTALMECAQSAGIDLPMKVLVWEDSTGQVYAAYNDPAYLAKRHDVAKCPVIEAMTKALAGVVSAAVSP
jgi:uncharacterized protein (DUF302 family)